MVNLIEKLIVPGMDPIAFGPLSIVIGPNGSGKSQLLKLLRRLPCTEGRAVRAAPEGDDTGDGFVDADLTRSRFYEFGSVRSGVFFLYDCIDFWRQHPELRGVLRQRLVDFDEWFEDFYFGTDEVLINGELCQPSDGMLRWLCLLAILLNPTPPPLVILADPDIGLHPDICVLLRDLLLEFSQRSQVIVTTHSVALVDAFSNHPECFLVCEKTSRGSTFHTLPKDLDCGKGLGSLWAGGFLGGVRW